MAAWLKRCASLAVPQLARCASSGRTWRLWAARHSQEEPGPPGAPPPPRMLEPAASKAADFTALDHPGLGARAISVSTHKREHVHLADNRARNAYIRPHTALRRLAAEQVREVRVS